MNRRMVAVGVIILLLVSVNVSGDIDTKEVSTVFDGNILYVGGNGPNNYTTINKALEVAVDGDTIFVYSKWYVTNNISIDKSICLIGESKEETIIDGGVYCNELITILADKVTITNFTIRNCNTRGIDICSDSNIIKNNIITDNSIGIRLSTNSENNIIKGNIFTNNNCGISAEMSDSTIIQDNVISDGSSIGIKIFDSAFCMIINNIISNINYDGIYITLSNDIMVYNNIITNSGKSGIRLKNDDNNTFSLNEIKNIRGIGIDIWNSKNNTFSYNNFKFIKRVVYFINIDNCHWIQNYWNRPRFVPKILFGIKIINLHNRFRINIDFRPAKLPNRVEVV